MRLPDPTPVTEAAIAAICARHGLPDGPARQLPSLGLTNTVYLLGEDIILRVPRDHPRFIATVANEAIAAPLARAAGVRTPALLAHDDARDLLPVPYTLYERAPGVTLATACGDPALAAAVWRTLGGELARMHTRIARTGRAAELEVDEPPDPRAWVERLATEGYVTAVEARWFAGWLARLEPAALALVEPRFLHADTQATNLMVNPSDLSYVALIDWGDARWGDPGFDFIGMPPRAAPWALQGYRAAWASEGGAVEELAGLEARVLWHMLAQALRHISRDPAPDLSWAERPLTSLLDLLRFLYEGPATDAADWRGWLPDRAPAQPGELG